MVGEVKIGTTLGWLAGSVEHMTDLRVVEFDPHVGYRDYLTEKKCKKKKKGKKENRHNSFGGQFASIYQDFKNTLIGLLNPISRNLACKYNYMSTQRYKYKDVHCSIVCICQNSKGSGGDI